MDLKLVDVSTSDAAWPSGRPCTAASSIAPTTTATGSSLLHDRPILGGSGLGRLAEFADAELDPSVIAPPSRGPSPMSSMPSTLAPPMPSDAGARDSVMPERAPSPAILRPLLIGHDASRTGAPLVLLRLIRWLRERTAMRPSVLLLEGGPLADDFRALTPTWILQEALESSIVPLSLRRSRGFQWLANAGARRIVRQIAATKPDLIYANTAAVRPGLDLLEGIDAPIVVHIHELETVLRSIGTFNVAKVLRRADRVVAASLAVRENLVARHGVDPTRLDVVHEFIPTAPSLIGVRDDRRRMLAEALGVDLAEGVGLVVAVGNLGWRKGSDLFVPLARSVLSRLGGRPVHFVWIGGFLGEVDRHRREAETAGLGGVVHYLGSRPDPLNLFDACDVFALLSREDPYPLVMLEAAALGKPIVCFGGSGGAPEFVEGDAGVAVPYGDVESMAVRVVELLGDPDRRDALGNAARDKVQAEHDLEIAAPRILDVIRRAVEGRRPDRVTP